MTTLGKTITTIVILIILGIGAGMYFLRPVVAPTEDLTAEQATTTDQGMMNGSATSTNSNGMTSTSTASTTATGSVASYKIATGSKAEFNIMEVLRGSDFKVIGTTNQVSGTIQADLNNPSNSIIGEIKINARTFKTDASSRDNAIARFVLKSEDAGNEFVTFKAKEISGLPSEADIKAKIASNSAIAFKIKGDLTITGITKSVVFDASFSLNKSGQIVGSAQSTIKRSDFKLTIPSVPFVASVEDELVIKIDAVLAKE